jgi:hypothetical protein
MGEKVAVREKAPVIFVENMRHQDYNQLFLCPRW